MNDKVIILEDKLDSIIDKIDVLLNYVLNNNKHDNYGKECRIRYYKEHNQSNILR